MPDDGLFRAAEQKKLHSPETLNAQIRRMLADPKSSALVENFGEPMAESSPDGSNQARCGKFNMVDTSFSIICGGKATVHRRCVRGEPKRVDLIDAALPSSMGRWRATTA